MSNETSKDLLHGSVDLSLQEIDRLSFDPTCVSRDTHTVGPFAVLNLLTSTNEDSIRDASPRAGNTYLSAHPSPPKESLLTTAGFDISPWADGLLQWSDLFNPNDGLWGLSSDVFVECDNGPDFTLCTPICSPKDTIFADVNTIESNVFDPPVLAPQPPVDLLEKAGFLLRHFRKVVVPQLTIFPPTEPPWDILNIPAALETLGQLTVLDSDNVSHARMANLYSLIACSATHLATAPLIDMTEFDTKVYWKSVSDQAYSEAKHNMEISLSTESDGSRKAKFKDHMMALYGITECAVRRSSCFFSSLEIKMDINHLPQIFCCQHRDARCYLMHAERLLRSRGLTKRKISRKVRLLFNVYTWLRIVGESTYVLHNHSSAETFVKAINLHCQPRDSTTTENPVGSVNNHGLRLDDFLHFENLENNLNIDDPKDHRIVLSDFHLQDSRKPSGSLSHQVYGMSETWLSLVSQTTRLANVMDALNNAQETELPVAPHVLKAVQRRKLRLENVIQYFARRSTLVSNQGSGQSTSNAYMIRALNSALVILFYRRVRRVHPAILASHVDDVIAALEGFWTNVDHETIPGPGTLWPVFIAGSEAISDIQREAISKLVERGKSRSGLVPFELLKDILSSVWAMQDEPGTVDRDHGQAFPTWIDLLRSRQSWPIFA